MSAFHDHRRAEILHHHKPSSPLIPAIGLKKHGFCVLTGVQSHAVMKHPAIASLGGVPVRAVLSGAEAAAGSGRQDMPVPVQ